MRQGGRVVGDRVGDVDYALDILRVHGGGRSSNCPPTRAAMRGQRRPDGRPFPPYRLSSSFGGAVGAEPGACVPHPLLGRIPTGDTVLTTTFDDGRTRRDVLPNFGF